ncbi:MAG TPA: cytochrome c biogenesis protein CcdA [Pirellulales bacterium]|nr:cytochrome c biogenesis protein CcdA [Pirellulales bacterium]
MFFAIHAEAQVGSFDLGVGASSGASLGEKLKASAFFTPAEAGKPAMLFVTANLAPGWHTYSLTQAPGGPNKSQIKLTASGDYKLLGEFQPKAAAEVHHYEDIWPGLAVEEHTGQVTWSAPLEIVAGVNPAKLEIAGAVHAQVCAKECLPPTDYKFVAHLASAKEAAAVANQAAAAGNTTDAAPPAGVARYKPSFSHVTLSGVVEPAAAKPDSIVHLTITAEPSAGWHIYALAEKDPVDVSKPTLIVLTNSSQFRFRSPRASAAPVQTSSTVTRSSKVEYYEKPVSWTIDLEIPANTKPGDYPIAGIVGYQTCSDSSCDGPKAAWFDGHITVGGAAVTGATGNGAAGGIPMLFREAQYDQAAKLAEQAVNQNGAAAPKPAAGTSSSATPEPNSALSEKAPIAAEPMESKSLAAVLLSAFFGGIILNLMPCVLPVIGLKLLTFVEQSHQHRSRVFMLNVWYTLGLLTVFMVLATLACGFKLSWGQQFSSTAFNIVMSCVVFVMALSFLGVWEIPIPGFVGSGKAAEAATHEGAAGAFAKGVVSTILATPCSGPLLGPVFGFTLRQPPGVIYAIFASIGLGMAAPYLVIGGFPRLIRFLPRPGAWMDTFKHIMGFVLLGTVVFLFTFLDRDYVVPTFGLLVALWAACWWIGRVPLTAELGPKLKSWAQGAITAGVLGYAAFAVLLPHAPVLPWQPFSVESLGKYRGEGKTVLVDFTADWCLTCKLNLKTAIDTQDVLKVIQANNVVPLLADWTHESQEIKDTLAALNWNSIPVLAIFPADQPEKPIVLHDLITQSQLLEALKQAGPSQQAVAGKQTAMQ